MSSLRMRSLEYIHKNGNFMTYQDVAAGLNENPQRVRGALGDASKEGYLSFGRDDVTQQGGYSLTSKGKARIVNGHQTINGKQASENKKACDEREAAAHVMSAPVVDTTADKVEFELDSVFLAAANRTLSEKNDKLQKRIEGLEQDREKQRTLLAGKTERIAKLIAVHCQCGMIALATQIQQRLRHIFKT
jgi:Mn-dependent DtxR family transcriptional regulator